MKYIGAHVSIQGGIFNAPLQAQKIGAKAFAFFTKNQKRWFANPYALDEISAFKNNLKQSGILAKHILPHSSYLINLGHPDEKRRIISIDALVDEIHRCEQLGLNKLNFHPGSHLKLITELKCLDYVAKSINAAHAKTDKIILVIENTAGQGSNLGYTFEHLAYLISKIKDKKRIGVCIDTCHLFVAGYDFSTKEKYEKIWQLFDKVVGFKYLQGMHLNDSKGALGSKIDRHDSIGKGNIGLEPFGFFMQDPRFDDLPLILETIDHQIWEQEIKYLYSLT